MPNKRAEGRTVSSFSAPADLLAAARAKAAERGESLSAVIVGALRRYVARP